MKERLKQLRKHLKLTQGEFGRKLGMSDLSVSYMESGRTTLSNQNVNLICLTFKINEEWFRYGTGEMMLPEATEVEPSEEGKRLMILFEKLSPTARQLLIEWAEGLVAKEKIARGEAPIQPREAPQHQKGENPVHSMKMG